MDRHRTEAEILSTRAGLARAVFEARMAFIGSTATRRTEDADAWEAVAAVSLGGARTGRTLQDVFEERSGGGGDGDARGVQDGFGWVARVLRGANELRRTMREELAGSGAAWTQVEWNGLPLMLWKPAADLETARARARDQCGKEAAFYVTMQAEPTRRRWSPRMFQVAQGEWESVWAYDQENAAAQWHQRAAKRDDTGGRSQGGAGLLTAGALMRLLKERGKDEAWYENAPMNVLVARWEQGADRAEDEPIEYLSADATDMVLDSGHVCIKAETSESPEGMSRMMRLTRPRPGEGGVRRYMGLQAEVRWDDVRDAGITLEEATAAFDKAAKDSTLLPIEHGMQDGKEPEPGALWKMTVHEPDCDWKRISPTLAELMGLAWYGLAEIGTDG